MKKRKRRPLCPVKESGGYQCEKRLHHKGEHACPEALANWLRMRNRGGGIPFTQIVLVR